MTPKLSLFILFERTFKTMKKINLKFFHMTSKCLRILVCELVLISSYYNIYSDLKDSSVLFGLWVNCIFEVLVTENVGALPLVLIKKMNGPALT